MTRTPGAALIASRRSLGEEAGENGDRVHTTVQVRLKAVRVSAVQAKRLATLAAAASFTLAGAGSSARAAGLFLTEMATPDMGRAAAGRAAIAEDAATAFTNPAGMTRLEGTHLLAGLQGGFGNVRFDRGNGTTVSGGNGGNASGAFPGAGLYAVHSITPDLRIGLSLGSNFGGMLEYERGWSGRYYGTKADLVTFGAYPVAAYKVTDWLSVGAGAQIVYGRLNNKTSVAAPLGGSDGQIQLESSDVGFGGTAGVLIEPVAGTRFGVTYTSLVDLDFEQRPDLTGGGPVFDALDPRISTADVDLGLTIPQTVMLSGYHDLTPAIAVMGNVTWQNWSKFGQPSLEISGATTSQTTANLDYNDTWGLALGARWRVLPKLSWSAGVAFDTSPMSKSQRTPALPLDQQIRVGTGVQYALADGVSLGAAYQYLNLGEGDLDRERGSLSGRLQGNYSTNEVHFVNVSVAWGF